MDCIDLWPDLGLVDRFIKTLDRNKKVYSKMYLKDDTNSEFPHHFLSYWWILHESMAVDKFSRVPRCEHFD